MSAHNPLADGERPAKSRAAESSALAQKRT